MKKKGQIALIFIIGAIIIASVIAFYTVNKYVLKAGFEKEIEEAEKIPLQIKPVKFYLDSCVKDIAIKAIDIASVQGGYIDLPREAQVGNPFSIPENLEILPGLETPLWFRESPNGIQILKIPSKEEIQNQLNYYINNNIDRCIENLSSFILQGYEISIKGSPETKTEISDELINVKVNYPVNVGIKDVSFDLNLHYAKVESSIGLLYKHAVEIMKKLNDELFLEQKTIDILVSYNEIPFSGTEVTCSEKIWSKIETIQKLKQILMPNIQIIKVKNTNYEIPKKYEAYYTLNVDGLNKDISVNFLYSPSWPTYINIEPSQGDILKTDSLVRSTGSKITNFIASFLCLNNYHFGYDIKYPVLIMLRKGNSFFQFATEVIVDDNRPRKNTEVVIQEELKANEACNYKTSQVSLNVLAENAVGFERLDDAEIFFKCYPAVCPLGKSFQREFNVPICFNGVLEARKQGHYPGKIVISTNEPGQQAEIILQKLYQKDVKVLVISKTTGSIRPLNENEQALFLFRHKDIDYSTTFSWGKIELLPGDYQIESYIMGKTENIKVPSKKVTKCIDVAEEGILAIFKTRQKCFESETPGFEINQILKGGAKFEHTFTSSSLESSRPLTLYILADEPSLEPDEIFRIQEEIETNNEHKYFRYPRI